MSFGGTIAIRAMKDGDFTAASYPGTTAGLQSAVAYAGAKGKVSIGPGTLALTAGVNITADVHIQGCGKGKTILTGTGAITAFTVSSSFTLSDLTLDTWDRGVDFSSVATTVDNIRITNVEIKNYNRGIYANNLNPGQGVDKFHVENCDLTTGTLYAIFVNTYVIGKSVVKGCRIKTFKDRGISFGNNTVALEDIRGPYDIEGNYVEDGTNASTSAVEGIILHGWRGRVVANEVRDIRRTDPTESDCEGIYVKCRYSVVANNILVDAGQGEAMIDLKGGARNETVVQPYGFSVICANNQCVDTQTAPTTPTGKRTSGIKIATSECLVIGNEISGMTDAGIYDDSDGGADTPNHNITVTNNIVKDTRGKYGIALFGRGNNIRVVNNLVDTVLRTYDASGQSFGINMVKKAGTGLDVCSNRVKNIVDYGQTPVGVMLNPGHLSNTIAAGPLGEAAVDTATDTLRTGSTAHTLLVNDQVKFTNSGGGLPSPLVAGTIYFIKTVPTSTTFTLSATLGGATIDITTAGTGTHTVRRMTTHTNWCVMDNNVDTAQWGVQFTWDQTYADVDGCITRHNTGRNINGNVIPAADDLLKYSDLPTNLIDIKAENPVLFYEATDDAAMRNGTNPQEIRIYGTWTSSTNFERLLLQTTASSTRVLSEAGSGGGTARPLEWGVGANKWRVTGSGHVEAMTNNAFDHGVSGSAPRDTITARHFQGIGSGAYNTGHIILGNYHIWVEQATDKLRIKNGAPSSDSDGTVVGTQT